MIQRDQEGKARQPGGLSGRGEPYQGVPRRTQSCKNASTNKNRVSEKKRKNASTRWRGFSLRKMRNCGRGDIRGRPAGRLSLFWGCARGATGLDFAFCGKRGRGFAPSIPTSLLKKAGPKTFFGLMDGEIIEAPGLQGGRAAFRKVPSGRAERFFGRTGCKRLNPFQQD